MLRRRVYDPIDLVLAEDPAIEGGYEVYAKHWDMTKLLLKPNEQPTVFKVQQLTERQRDACWRIDTIIDRCTLALRYGLLDVRNYGIVTPSGEQQLLTTPDRGNGEHGSMVTQEWMDKARLLSAEKLAVGSVIITLTEARPPLS